MSRSDDAQLSRIWWRWAVALVVMAMPLALVSVEAMDEPLYVAGSLPPAIEVTDVGTHAVWLESNARACDALRSAEAKGRCSSRMLAMLQPR